MATATVEPGVAYVIGAWVVTDGLVGVPPAEEQGVHGPAADDAHHVDTGLGVDCACATIGANRRNTATHKLRIVFSYQRHAILRQLCDRLIYTLIQDLSYTV